MTLVIPKLVVRNWYQNEVSYSADFIASFVEGVEKVATEFATSYEQKKQIEVVEDGRDEQYVRISHQGLDGETWDLPTIFGEYFPSLHRRSALLTLCSYFEYELEKLCKLYQTEKSWELAPSDIKGHGIYRSTTYLEKMAGLGVHRASQEWKDISVIQKVRNVLVHNGGRLDAGSGDCEAIVAFMKKVKSLRSNEDEIVLDSGFLAYVVQTFKSYFKLIGDSIATAKQ
jgi:hypothetical protein